MPDIEEMKDHTTDSAQPTGQQSAQQRQSMKDKASGAMKDAKKRMDATGDGKIDPEDVKRMGEDAVNKVKGMFKKD